MPKILLIDIETAPITASTWGLFKQNIGLSMIQQDWFIMSYAAKWAGDDEMIYADNRDCFGDDKELVKAVHRLFDEADFVVAHNGDKFDIKKLNARFLLNGLTPPAPYRTIDTLKMAKKTFAFTSNKLQYLSEQLTDEVKLKHQKFAGFELWKACMQGNLEAWEEMEAYNRQDVKALEALFERLKPWYPSMPNVNGTLEDSELEKAPRCPKCGSSHIVKRGFYRTNKSKMQRYQCMDCHGWSSKTTTVRSLEARTNLLQSR